MPTREELELDQMTVNIEKMRADMANDQKRLAWENREFAVSLIVAAAALVGAGVVLGNYIGSRRPAPQTVQVLQLPPGTTITIPPAPPRAP